MGYSKKKKVVKKTTKTQSKKESLTENLVNHFGPLNEWSETHSGTKRWSKNYNEDTDGLTEFEKEQMNEGPSYEYARYIKKIDKFEKAYHDAIEDFE